VVLLSQVLKSDSFVEFQINVFLTYTSIYKTCSIKNIRETFINELFSKVNINKYFLSLSQHIYNQITINNHLIRIIQKLFLIYEHHFNSSVSPKIIENQFLYVFQISQSNYTMIQKYVKMKLICYNSYFKM